MAAVGGVMMIDVFWNSVIKLITNEMKMVEIIKKYLWRIPFLDNLSALRPLTFLGFSE